MAMRPPGITRQYFTWGGITTHDDGMSREVAQTSLADLLRDWGADVDVVVGAQGAPPSLTARVGLA
jgi:hypothetical protein